MGGGGRAETGYSLTGGGGGRERERETWNSLTRMGVGVGWAGNSLTGGRGTGNSLTGGGGRDWVFIDEDGWGGGGLGIH